MGELGREKRKPQGARAMGGDLNAHRHFKRNLEGAMEPYFSKQQAMMPEVSTRCIPRFLLFHSSLLD